MKNLALFGPKMAVLGPKLPFGPKIATPDNKMGPFGAFQGLLGDLFIFRFQKNILICNILKLGDVFKFGQFWLKGVIKMGQIDKAKMAENHFRRKNIHSRDIFNLYVNFQVISTIFKVSINMKPKCLLALNKRPTVCRGGERSGIWSSL